MMTQPSNDASRQAWLDMMVICEQRPQQKHGKTPFHRTDGDAAPLWLAEAEHGYEEAKLLGHGLTYLPTTGGLN